MTPDKRDRLAGNPIHFIGAGPGDPELITRKGKRLMEEADLIIYAGSLVNPEILKGLKATIYDSSGMDLDNIIETMAAAWQRGKRVARLHTGDPSIYGAIGEQIDRLEKRGIPCRIIPGVTSAFAAAAALQVELTVPEVTQTVIFTRIAGRTPVPDREDMAGLAAHQATMCIFLSVSMMDQLCRELLKGGYPPDTPVAVVEKASWPEEKRITGTIQDIADKIRDANIRKTAMILVGKALAGTGGRESMLYHKHFSHEFRNARSADGNSKIKDPDDT